MVICVYGSASRDIGDNFKNGIFNLCKTLAESGHSLVYGGGGEGSMGASARGFKAGGGKIHGVIPKFLKDSGYEEVFLDCDTLTVTETMAERKTIMENECEVFIITPGGIGTMEEFFQVLTLKQLGRHKKAIVIFNLDGYYDKLLDFYEHMIDVHFVKKECKKLFGVCNTEKDVIKYLKNYKQDSVKWNLLKKDN